MPQLLQQRHTKTIQYFTEDLSQQVSLEMAYIPSGKFQMGSPEDELDRFDNESPQHGVTVSEFFMGRFLVSQAQWRVVVAGFPKVARNLKLNPSNFKSKTEDRPVERVSWLDTQEFCKRLSKRVGRSYRLPSEAEWEYACRAGMTTPFHFGETISSDVANYDSRSAY
jgi:formylglycine-generating enzyme required for sulfatase activity